MRALPSTAEVESSTPPGRDRVLDLVRICSLLVVITAHAAMAVVYVETGPDGGAETSVRLDNLLGLRPWLQPLTWALQVLPLFFFAGAAASAIPWISSDPDRRPAGWGTWLLGRCRRLYRPLVVYVAVWAVVLLLTAPVVPDPVLGALRGISTQLAWFLGVYVMVLAAMPALARIRTVRGLVLVVAGLGAAVALVDAGRLTGVLPSAVGSVNFLLAWLVPAALGVGYIRGLLRPAVCAVVAGVALAADVALVALGPYETSLVTVPGQVISNMTPPSLLIVGHSVVLCCLLVVVHPLLARLAARPRVWRWVAIGNGGAMTLYLWHLPCVVVTVAVVRLLSGVEGPDDAGFWPLLLVRVVCVYALTGLLFVPLSAVENARWRWWDDPVGDVGRGRSVLIGSLLAISGVLVLLHARWGLAEDGVTAMASALLLAVLARACAGPTRGGEPTGPVRRGRSAQTTPFS